MDFCGRLQNLPEVFWLQLIEKNLVVLANCARIYNGFLGNTFTERIIWVDL